MLDGNPQTLFKKRILLVGGIVFTLLLVIFARVWYLQVTRKDYYLDLAERNRLRSSDIQAPRGLIFDRNGKVLIENEPAFALVLRREFMKDEGSLRRVLKSVFGLDEESIEHKFDSYRNIPIVLPVILKTRLDFHEIAFVEAHRSEYPELSLEWEPNRRYIYGESLCHILGYIGEVTESELGRPEFAGLNPGTIVGKSGLERFYNTSLAGTNGHRQSIINSMGQVTRVLQEVPAHVGDNLNLTVDIDLQKTAEAAMEGLKGSLVAMDPRTGAIYCMVSKPGFDPNIFTGHISVADWRNLILNPDRPLRNNTIQGAYAPGSIFKVLTAMGALGESKIAPSTTIFCGGATELAGRVVHCWNSSGHGSVSLNSAIANSCNIYFYNLGLRLGVDSIKSWSDKVGLGNKTGVDLPGERSGLVPSTAWKERTFHKPWIRSETVSVAIGQGAVAVTPIQVARFMSAVAMNRTPPVPHLRRDAPNTQPDSSQQLLDPDTMALVVNGMENVIRSGTGTRAQLPGIRVAGKTGTAQILSTKTAERMANYQQEFKENSWFACFAPVDNPRIAIAVIIEHGGHGGVAAAPVAAAVMRKFFGLPADPSAVTPEPQAEPDAQ